MNLGSHYALGLPMLTFTPTSTKAGRMEFSAARSVWKRRILGFPRSENTSQMARPGGAWTRCDGPSSGLATMTILR